MAVGAVIAIAAVGVGYGVTEQRKARKAGEEANRRAARIESLREQRDITDRIRQQRIASASIEAAGVGNGLSGQSSPFVNAQSALESDTNANVRLLGQVGGLRRQKLEFQRIAEARLARSDLGFTTANMALGFA